MNLAFSAVVLSFLAAPGFLFWYGYAYEERTTAGAEFDTSFAQVLSAFITSAMLHLIWCPLAFGLSHWTGVLPSPKNAFALIAAAYGDDARYFEMFSGSIQSVTANLGWVASYFVSLYFVAPILGILLRVAVRASAADRIFPFLRYSEWYYILEDNRYRRATDGECAAYVAATVTHADGSYLYVGLLHDFDVDLPNQLKRLVLRHTQRRKLCDDKTATTAPNSRYYRLRGQFFVLEYEQVVTMTVTYLSMVPSHTGPRQVPVQTNPTPQPKHAPPQPAKPAQKKK